MEAVVVVAVAVLGVLFVTAVVLLALVCRYKLRRVDLLTQQHRQYAPDQTLVTSEGEGESEAGGVALQHVTARALEAGLQDADWLHDVTGLAPHCLAILRTCHVLSERLVAMTMRGSTRELCTPETTSDLVATAQRIGPRVDEVMRALYPPLDPRLLEARCTALVLSVSHLVLITKNACRLSGELDWIDQSLADVDEHLTVLREASVSFDEASPRKQQHVLQQTTHTPDQPDTHSPSLTTSHTSDLTASTLPRRQQNAMKLTQLHPNSQPDSAARAWVSAQHSASHLGLHEGVSVRTRDTEATPSFSATTITPANQRSSNTDVPPPANQNAGDGARGIMDVLQTANGSPDLSMPRPVTSHNSPSNSANQITANHDHDQRGHELQVFSE